MSILAGKPRPRKVPKIRDRVMVVDRITGEELVGYVLNITKHSIRISSQKEDDGGPFPNFDWIRSSRPLSEVQVLPC